MEESIIPTGPRFDRIVLSDQNKEDLVNLGALHWGEDRISAFFGWDREALHRELSDENSEISKLLMRGELEAAFKLESKMLADAQAGNLSSAKELRDIVRDREFRLSKIDLFGGSEDKELFGKIQKYISDGCPGDMTTREQLYLDGLQMIYSMDIKFGTRKTVKLLTKEPYKMKYDRARDLVAEAVELFNGGRRSTKEAMRYHIADTFDTLYHAALDVAKTTQDYQIAASILDRKTKLLQLDQPDEKVLPAEMYNKTYRVLSLTTESLGLPAANRDELAAQIDALDIPDTERRRIRMEAGVEDADIVEILNNVKEEN